MQYQMSTFYQFCHSDLAHSCSATFGDDQLGVNAAIIQLTNIITTATRLFITPNFSGRQKKWYDRNCLQVRNELNRLGRCLS